MFSHEVVRGAWFTLWPFAAPCKMSGRCVIDDDRASTTCRPTANERGGKQGDLLQIGKRETETERWSLTLGEKSHHYH